MSGAASGGRIDAFDAAGRRMAPVLTRWRRELGWTQHELATRAGLSRGYLSQLERGVPGQPGIELLGRVCAALGRSWTELYAAAGLPLPGDVTLAEIGAGINDPELALYLRRLPELDARDRAVLRALLRAFFEQERAPFARPGAQADARQLGLPAVAASDGRSSDAERPDSSSAISK